MITDTAAMTPSNKVTSPIYQRLRIKMCGFTRPADVQAAVQAGADAIGLVFYPKSKRYVQLEQALQLRAQIPAFVQCVALFVNAKPATVQQVIAQVQPDVLQFHGDESVAYCESFGHPYIRAFRVGAPGMDSAEGLLSTCRQYSGAQGWLFDSYSPAYGGSGLSFDAKLLKAVHEQRASHEPPVILAGGVTAQNLQENVALHQPFAVDISSAIESAPGLKEAEKMQAFMQQVALCR